MEGIRRQYNEKFEKDAVGHSMTSEKTVEEVAQNLGIAHSNLRRWRAQYHKKEELAFPGNSKQRLTPQEEEIRRLRKELYDVRQERDILKKLWPSSPKTVDSFRFIREHADRFSVMKLCQVLKVSRFGYYQWIKYPNNKRKVEDRDLKQEIIVIYYNSRKTYGSFPESIRHF